MVQLISVGKPQTLTSSVLGVLSAPGSILRLSRVDTVCVMNLACIVFNLLSLTDTAISLNCMKCHLAIKLYAITSLP